MGNHPTLTTPVNPLSVGRLALALTGYTITGADGATLDPASGCVPRGPYTVSDAEGAVIGRMDIHWQAERLAVRTWRQRVTNTDSALTPVAVEEQLRLRVEIRSLEAQAAALEARIKAIDAAHGEDIWFLDHALETYGEAVQAHDTALTAWASYSVEVAA